MESKPIKFGRTTGGSDGFLTFDDAKSAAERLSNDSGTEVRVVERVIRAFSSSAKIVCKVIWLTFGVTSNGSEGCVVEDGKVVGPGEDSIVAMFSAVLVVEKSSTNRTSSFNSTTILIVPCVEFLKVFLETPSGNTARYISPRVTPSRV